MKNVTKKTIVGDNLHGKCTPPNLKVLLLHLAAQVLTDLFSKSFSDFIAINNQLPEGFHWTKELHSIQTEHIHMIVCLWSINTVPRA